VERIMMSKARSTLCAVYVGLALLALVSTWRQNIAFIADTGGGFVEGFTAFWLALFVNRATTSITIDIFLFGAAAVIWMVLEARRLAVRGVWLYVVFGLLIAISVTFPLFLAARERRLAALAATDTEPHPSPSDTLGLAVFGLPIVAFAIWCTLR
jgi:hypothetical protein